MDTPIKQLMKKVDHLKLQVEYLIKIQVILATQFNMTRLIHNGMLKLQQQQLKTNIYPTIVSLGTTALGDLRLQEPLLREESDSRSGT